MWSRLTELYGRVWTDKYGSQPNKTWCERIGELSNNQIMHTLTVLADREGFPPDVGEFTVIAKTAKGGESNQQQEKVWGKIDRLRRIAFDHGMSLAEAQQMPPNELAAWVQERAEA